MMHGLTESHRGDQSISLDEAVLLLAHGDVTRFTTRKLQGFRPAAPRPAPLERSEVSTITLKEIKAKSILKDVNIDDLTTHAMRIESVGLA